MPPPVTFTYTFSVPESAIDEYGHVNNVVYVQWMQEAAIRHGESIADYKLAENTGWFARQHLIEYLTPAYQGDKLEVRTWLVAMSGVRAQRRYEFVRLTDGKTIAQGETVWIYVDLSTGRPIAIPADILAQFPVAAEQGDSSLQP
jgi:acyl-CoA thioester hydrolase